MKNAWPRHIFIMQVHCSRYMKRIYTTFFFQIRCNCSCILRCLTSHHIVRTIDSADYSKCSTCFFTDIFYDHFWKTHTIFKASAKFILPFIGSFRDKRTYKISMGTMYFHCICSRLFRPQSRISVSLDQPVQFFRRNCFWDFCLHRGRNTACRF